MSPQAAEQEEVDAAELVAMGRTEEGEAEGKKRGRGRPPDSLNRTTVQRQMAQESTSSSEPESFAKKKVEVEESASWSASS